jgi:hypothetical protein
MNERIVVQLMNYGGKVLLQVAEPLGYPGLSDFVCPGTDPVFSSLRSATPDGDVVTAAGRVLFDAVTSSEQVRDILTVALAVQDPERRPIYLNLSDAIAAQALPWEALCTRSGTFLAMQPAWPVARMLSGLRKPLTHRTLEPPLRIAAILSCLDVGAEGEWDALRKAVESSGAQVRMLLLVSETELHDTIDAMALPWLEVQMVPQEFRDMQALITDFEPHVLHFFCHGLATGGAHLEIATAADILAGTHTSHHRLEARSIRELVQAPKQTPWAIVLNACGSAALDVVATPPGSAGDRSPDDEIAGTHSLAASLVVEQGVPAVVGMREPVIDSDAARFTGAFYAALLTDLAGRIEARDRGITIDWAAYTVEARADLCRDRGITPDVAAARFQQWTLPVVVVHPSQFTVDVAGAGPIDSDARDKASRLSEGSSAILAALPPGTPAQTVAAFEAMLREQTLRAGGRS